jgi:hypothetical protein
LTPTGLTLDDLEGAYRRISRAVHRAQEDAYEFTAADAWDALERDELILDAAFFGLLFGQLEKRINRLAERSLTKESEKQALRSQPFERRLQMALPHQVTSRDEIWGWYRLRRGVAHGDPLASEFNFPAVLQRARELDTLLEDAA